MRQGAGSIAEVHERPAPSGRAPLRRPRPRILVVEDHEETREAVSMLLTTEGYEVALAADGEAGVASARASPPNVAIVDIFLPVKDGVAVIEELCRDMPAVTIIAVSADTSLDRRGALIRAREAGAHLTLRKPLEPWVLLKTLEAVVSGSPLRSGDS
jgi:DNA-binding response OmpR family regulator